MGTIVLTYKNSSANRSLPTDMSTSYAKRMAHLSARIFGQIARDTDNKSTKVVKLFSGLPKDQNPTIVNWYPNHPQLHGLMVKLRSLGLYRDEHLDFKDEIKRLRALRGKTKPKKGEGKKAMKRK